MLGFEAPDPLLGPLVLRGPVEELPRPDVTLGARFLGGDREGLQAVERGGAERLVKRRGFVERVNQIRLSRISAIASMIRCRLRIETRSASWRIRSCTRRIRVARSSRDGIPVSPQPHFSQCS
jgi:hypothetical protein